MEVKYIVVMFGINKVLFGTGDELENITRVKSRQLPNVIKSFATNYGYVDKEDANERLKQESIHPDGHRYYVFEMRV